jgi:hypothetical protein
MSLVARTSSTCESVTGEGSGFKGANGTGGSPGVGVRDTMNSGEMTEDPASCGRGWVRRGESEERGEEAQAGGGRASGVHFFAVEAFGILQSRGGRGGREGGGGPGGVTGLRQGPHDRPAFFSMEKKDPDP